MSVGGAVHRAGLHALIRPACRRGRYCWEKKVHGHIRYPLDGLQAFLRRLQVQQGRLCRFPADCRPAEERPGMCCLSRLSPPAETC